MVVEKQEFFEGEDVAVVTPGRYDWNKPDNEVPKQSYLRISVF